MSLPKPTRQPTEAFTASITLRYSDVLQSPELLRDLLTDKGVAVVLGVLSPTETEEALSLVWDYMESLGTGIKRDDFATHGNDRWLPTFSNGILSHPDGHAGQSTALWYARGHEGVQTCFRALHDEQGKLITSFDTMGLYRNPDYDAKYATGKDLWYHVDQNNTQLKDPNYSTQGLVNLLDTTAATEGGLVVLPESHKLFSEYDQLGRLGHFTPLYQLEDPDTAAFWSLVAQHPEMAPVRIGAPAGSLVLFRSSLVHCNMPCLRRKPADLTQTLRRAVLYVCMEPFSRYDDKDYLWRTERANALAAGLTSSHWPQELKSKRRPRFPLKRDKLCDDLDELQRRGTVLHSPEQLTQSQKAVL